MAKIKFIERLLTSRLRKWMTRGKVIILYGARQVGKTTLCRRLLTDYGEKAVELNCDILSVRQSLSAPDPLALKKIIGDHQYLFIDEAQRVPDIGLVLKVLIDSYPDLTIIASGSSSFELGNRIKEPLTGRSIEFLLTPFSYMEIINTFHTWEKEAALEYFLRFGLYPEVVLAQEELSRDLLQNITGNYLYKDIFEHEQLKKPALLTSLLQLLALQIGSEVSLHELALNLKVSRETVSRYMDLLKKTFVIFELSAFSRNQRKEISKKSKIYFHDLGIRNSLINNYNRLAIRNDIGGLWENFLIAERLKTLGNIGIYRNSFFWRGYQQSEIDYVEEYDGKIFAYEIKWKRNKRKIGAKFLETYPGSNLKIIDRNNFEDFIALKI